MAPVFTLRWRTASSVPASWMIGLAVAGAAVIIGAISIRSAISEVPIVYSPTTDQLVVSTSVKLASDGQLRDFAEMVTALGETWTWKTVLGTGKRLENYIHPTMRETARRRYEEFAEYAKKLQVGRVAVPSGSLVRERTAESAVVVVPYRRQEFTVTINGNREIYHGGSDRVLSLTLVQDLTSDTNATGIYILRREDQTREEYAAKYPDPFVQVATP